MRGQHRATRRNQGVFAEAVRRVLKESPAAERPVE